MTLNKGIEVVGPHITKAMLAMLQKFYVGLKLQTGDKVVLDPSQLTLNSIDKLISDLDFFNQNPNLPLENLCSRLDNYSPKDDSQRELLKYAGKLIEFSDSSRPAGIWAYGETGVGKSHIAVALAKEFMRRGYQPNFVQFGANNRLTTPKLAPQQVWILDDLNSPYGVDKEVFVKVSLNVFNTGGRIFVTSNMDYNIFMGKLSELIDSADSKRYIDRIQGTFKIIEVIGESYRKQNTWYTTNIPTSSIPSKADILPFVKPKPPSRRGQFSLKRIIKGDTF